jgi:hypothetical protein
MVERRKSGVFSFSGELERRHQLLLAPPLHFSFPSSLLQVEVSW